MSDENPYVRAGRVTLLVPTGEIRFKISVACGMPGRAIDAFLAFFEEHHYYESSPELYPDCISAMRRLARSPEVADALTRLEHALSGDAAEKFDSLVKELIFVASYAQSDFDALEVNPESGARVLPSHHAKLLLATADKLNECVDLLRRQVGRSASDEMWARPESVPDGILSKPVEVTAYLYAEDDDTGEMEPLAHRIRVSLLREHLALLAAAMASAMNDKAASLLSEPQKGKTLDWGGFAVRQIESVLVRHLGQSWDSSLSRVCNRVIRVMGNAAFDRANDDFTALTPEKVRDCRYSSKRR